MRRQVQAVVLAAGKGTRMKSRRPKVLHELCGQSLLAHTLTTLRACGIDDPLLVINPDLREPVEALGLKYAVQEPQNGTGHAMQIALGQLGKSDRPLLVISADMPLLPAALLTAVVERQAAMKADLVLVTTRVPLPSSFGRIVRRDGRILAIVEERDATAEQLRIDEVNAGVYCFASGALHGVIDQLRPENAQGELYLTDCIAALVEAGRAIEGIEAADPSHVMGINNRVELAAAGAIMRRRILEDHMLAGVTIVDPLTTYIDVGVNIEADTTIHPQSHLYGRCSVGRQCTVGPNTTIINSTLAHGVHVVQSWVRDSAIGAGVTVGPFAHLRGGSVVEEGAHIGNFVEMKKTRLGKGAKAGHLAYLGDADVGEHANIGAGTITCNYDGKRKNKTKIGRNAFIGSNSSLVAPVEIGADALTGAGAVVLRDVPDGERVAGNPAKPIRKKQPAEPS